MKNKELLIGVPNNQILDYVDKITIVSSDDGSVKQFEADLLMVPNDKTNFIPINWILENYSNQIILKMVHDWRKENQ